MSQAGLSSSAISSSMASIHAGIDVVQQGIARRVVIHVSGANRLLPAARAFARMAGLEARPVWSGDLDDCDIVIAREPVAGG